MSALTCSHCNSPLALADAACPACRTPVPAEARRALMIERADALAEQERWAEAARSLGGVPLDGLGLAEAKRVLRLRALWLQRSGAPGALDEAEACLAQVVALDQSDDLSHHAWMDVLKRRGRLDVAKAHYQGRLAQDPLDAVAMHQMSVLRLSEDMLLAAPQAKFNVPEIKGGLLQRWLRPTPYKMIVAGVTLLASLGGLVWGLINGPAAAAPAVAGSMTDAGAVAAAAEASGPLASMGLGGGGPLMAMLSDPWLNLGQALLMAAYLYWGWKERRG